MSKDCNQTWDQFGNLISEEWVEKKKDELPNLDHLSLSELAEIIRKRLEQNEQ